MRKHGQAGAVGTLAIICFLLALLLVAILVFAGWAYSGRRDYKNNVDKKIAVAVAEAKTQQKADSAKEFEEQAKSPTKAYSGSATYGTVSFAYPKTWNAYIDETSGSQPINAYYYPNTVPSTNSGVAYALRVQLVSDSYDSVLNGFAGALKNGSVKAAPYIAPKMKDVPNAQIGTRFEGMIGQKIQGSLVVLKVRDKTLKIWTESANFSGDFNNAVLASLTYVP